MKSAIGGGMRYDYAYDSMGRLTSKSASGRKLLAYTYDLNGNRSTMSNKEQMIEDWEAHYEQDWPVYGPGEAESSGYKSHREGNNYDAHEIIPNVYGGPMAWWNIVPAKKGSQHQGGIHKKGAPIDEFFPKGK